jgi:hypothetical protein
MCSASEFGARRSQLSLIERRDHKFMMLLGQAITQRYGGWHMRYCCVVQRTSC